VQIYLVDDDSEEAELFDEAIDRIDESIEVVWRNDVMEALEELMGADRQPDVLFLDLNIPRVSGKQLLQLLRNNKQTKDIPIVIYSTSISKKDIEDTQPYGVKAFVQKPESFSVLVERLRDVLEIDN
jgi:CheY-like chemotaxis protein